MNGILEWCQLNRCKWGHKVRSYNKFIILTPHKTFRHPTKSSSGLLKNTPKNFHNIWNNKSNPGFDSNHHLANKLANLSANTQYFLNFKYFVDICGHYKIPKKKLFTEFNYRGFLVVGESIVEDTNKNIMMIERSRLIEMREIERAGWCQW